MPIIANFPSLVTEQGSVVDPVLQNKTIVPTTSQQEIVADDGYDGLGTVTVESVTNNIDENISPSNIKAGVSILGVMGTYEGSSGGDSGAGGTTDVVIATYTENEAGERTYTIEATSGAIKNTVNSAGGTTCTLGG